MLGIIIGSGPYQRQDIEMFSKTFSIPKDRKVICVNHSCTFSCDVCVSQHGDVFPNHINVRDIIPSKYFRGTSGLHACWYAREILKMRRVVLLGLPLSDPYNHQHTMECWKVFYSEFGKYFRSFSFNNQEESFTIKLFGKPSKEWLHD